MPNQNVKSSPSSFADFYLSQATKDALTAIQYVTPTPVQAESIPLSMAGIDLIVQSQTGTGKTAAFAIPTLEMLDEQYNGIEALVLTPTRELAKQVSEEFKRLGEFKNLSVTAIYGGADYEPQRKALKTAQVLCATPGRLIDFLKQGAIDFSGLRMLILDEADEMLSMGFERELQEIIDFLPEERQSLLFSATVTEDVRDLAQKMLFYPEFLSFSSDSVSNVNVTHECYTISGIGRTRDLVRLIEYVDPETAIVFANTKADTFMVTDFLKRHNYRAEVLNGDLPQKERERTLKSLRDGKIDFLVATDVAARGIDINDLSHVINYTLPDSPEVYVHRTGRTGRAGKQGTAISLVSPAEQYLLIQIRKRVELPLLELELPETKRIVEAKRARLASSLGTRILRRFPELDITMTLPLARELVSPAASEEEADARIELVAKLLVLGNMALSTPSTPSVSPSRSDEREDAEEIEQDSSYQDDTSSTLAAHEEEEKETRTPPRRDANARDDREDEKAAPASQGREDLSSHDKDEDEDDASTDSGGRTRRRRRGRTSSSSRPPAQERVVASSAEEPPTQEPSEDEEDASSRRPRRSRSGRNGESRRGERPARERSSRERPSDEEESRRERRPARDAAPAREASVAKHAPAAASASHQMREFSLNQGQDAFKDRSEILKFLVFNSGMDEEDFGTIKIERNRAFVEVRQDYIYDVVEALNTLTIKDNRLEARVTRR